MHRRLQSSCSICLLRSEAWNSVITCDRSIKRFSCRYSEFTDTPIGFEDIYRPHLTVALLIVDGRPLSQRVHWPVYVAEGKIWMAEAISCTRKQLKHGSCSVPWWAFTDAFALWVAPGRLRGVVGAFWEACIDDVQPVLRSIRGQQSNGMLKG